MMKKIFTLCVAIFIASINVSFAQIRTALDLRGIWTSSQLRVEFLSDSKVSVVFPGNKKQVGDYTADFLLTPATLEMSFNDGNKKLEFICLVQFMDDNMLKWDTFSKGGHPRNFSRGAAILHKVKN